MSDFSAEDETPLPHPDDPHNEHERKIVNLHVSIWRTVQRLSRPLTQVPRFSSAQPYHPAYIAARVQFLESMVGIMASVLVQHKLIGIDALADKLGEVYIHDIEELQLRAAALHAAGFMAAAKSKPEPEGAHQTYYPPVVQEENS